MKQHEERLERDRKNNKDQQEAIIAEERKLAIQREKNSKIERDKADLEGEVAILRNQLSAFATELNNKRNAVSEINKVLEEKMERVEAAKKRYQAVQDRLDREKKSQDKLESAN